MKIAVCLKHVPDPNTVEVDPISGAISHDRLLYVTNPADEVALELALQLASERDEILAITVGAPAADQVLRAALAVGIGRTLRLDPQRNETEPGITSLLIATALKAESSPDLVLCGSRSADMGSGQVPALIAEHLGWAAATDVTQVTLRGGIALVQRRLERGAREELELRLPAVIAVEPGILRLRHAPLTGLMASQRANIPMRTPSSYGLMGGDLSFPSPTIRQVTPPHPRSRGIFTPDVSRSPYDRITQILTAGVTRKSGTILEGPPDKMADAIISFLHQHGFLETIHPAN